MKQCEICTKEFNPRTERSKYCSMKCLNLSQRKPKITRPCEECGKPVTRLLCHFKKNIFCSAECGNTFRKGKTPKWLTKEKRQELSQKRTKAWKDNRERMLGSRTRKKKIPCGFCKEMFSPVRKTSQFCSDVCRSLSQRKRVIKTCQWCKNEFETIKCFEFIGGKYCSKECFGMDRRGKSFYTPTENVRLESSKRMKNLWDSFGRQEYEVSRYPKIYLPNHPNAEKSGQIYEHRIVAESVIGRFLRDGEVIHHINEIRDDNRPENLYLFLSQGAHSSYHWDLRLHRAEPILRSNLADHVVSNIQDDDEKEN